MDFFFYIDAGKLTELWSNGGGSRCVHQVNVKEIPKSPLVCGQPTDATHPHIMCKGEVSI